MSLVGLTNDEKIWNYFKSKNMSEYGIAGLLGNLDFESALNPKNLENTYEKSIGYTDDSYVAAVDSGAYLRFVNDSAGFGLAQWTWWTRKQALQEFAKSRCVSIGDIEMQLDFLYNELSNSYKSVMNILMNAKSVREASNVVLLQFECPADQSVSMQDRRCALGQKYFEKFVTNKQGTAANSFVCVITPVNGYYYFPKESRIQLTKNFWSYEFDCHGVGCCTETKISVKLVELCQKIRDHFNSPVSISSPYRCPIRNGGTKNAATSSRHTMGDAADIVVGGHTPREVAMYCESIGILGIGLYETDTDGYFVHIDVRDYKSFWYGQACAARTTFGGAASTNTNIAAPVVNNTGVLYSGCSGASVKELQENLIKLGYNVGVCGADGEYGYYTALAVKEFQKDAGFTESEQDGKVGAQTKKAIEDALAKIAQKPVQYIVTAKTLNVRKGAGTNYGIVKTVKKNAVLNITKIENGWGCAEDGWVSMQYLKRKG